MPEKEIKNVTAFMERVKSNYSHSKKDGILELNDLVKPFFYDYVKPVVTNINNQLKKVDSISAPQFKIITNIDLNQNDLDRNFIQISYQEANAEYNPLTNPFLMVDFLPSGEVSFLTSDFKAIDKVNSIENIYISKNDLTEKFNLSFEKFLDKL